MLGDLRSIADLFGGDRSGRSARRAACAASGAARNIAEFSRELLFPKILWRAMHRPPQSAPSVRSVRSFPPQKLTMSRAMKGSVSRGHYPSSRPILTPQFAILCGREVLIANAELSQDFSNASAASSCARTALTVLVVEMCCRSSPPGQQRRERI